MVWSIAFIVFCFCLCVCLWVCLPLGNATLEADTIEGATNRNRQATVLVPLKEFLGFFFVCRPGRRGKLLRSLEVFFFKYIKYKTRDGETIEDAMSDSRKSNNRRIAKKDNTIDGGTFSRKSNHRRIAKTGTFCIVFLF